MTASDNFLPFTDTIKLYVYKQQNEVGLSFRITDRCVLNKHMSLSNFEYIINNWQTGVEALETDMGRVWWELRTVGPRPNREPADFVAINFGEWSFRLTIDEMQKLMLDFNTQINSVNHWD